MCTRRIIEYDEMRAETGHVATLVTSQRSTAYLREVCTCRIIEYDEMNVERGHSDHFMEVE